MWKGALAVYLKRLALDAAPCKEWTKYRDKDGYGRGHRVNGERYAHRRAWVLAYGPIPRGMCVLHRCDNPPCIEPLHLWLGTQADNTAEKVAKCRQCRGDTNGRAKLADDDVREIRKRYAAGGVSQESLACEYGVYQTKISNIVNRKSWRHVK